MGGKPADRKTALIGKVVEEARRRLGKAKRSAAERFIRQYYLHVPPDDILVHKPETLFRIAANHLAQGEVRVPGRPLVRVYNPDADGHGWQCGHAVVEVVNDDMPFLVDSVSALLGRHGITVHIVIHPIVSVRRARAGKRVDVLDVGRTDGAALRESYMHFQISQQPSHRLKELRDEVLRVLADVRAAVEDWRLMRQKMWNLIEEVEAGIKGVSAQDVSEVQDFLRWMHDNHFTFLGYRDYSFKESRKGGVSLVAPKSGMGILRDPSTVVFDEAGENGTVPPEVEAFRRHPGILMVTKSTEVSNVHRPVQLDVVGVKRVDARGRMVGQRLFAGLFTSAAYTARAREIPLLRRKFERIVRRAGFPPASHDGKALLNILETFPRDELFQVSDDHLFQTSMGILHLQERQRVALFVRRDELDRFMSCLVYVPRDRFNTDLRHRIQDILCAAFNGTISAFYTQYGESPLARLHILVKTVRGKMPSYDAADIERRIVEAARSWSDRLRDALIQASGEEKGLELLRRYGRAFHPGYQEQFSAQAAGVDIVELEKVLASGDIGLMLYRPDGLAPHQVRFKIYHPERPIPLSDVLPVFEHMGFRVVEERPHAVDPEGGTSVMIHDFGLEVRDGLALDIARVRRNFEDAFRRVWRGDTESDGFNALVARGGLTWREVVIIRTYCKYLRQAGSAFSQAYMERTVANYPAIARLIVDLFIALFDPDLGRNSTRVGKVGERLNAALEAVTSADDDRILRRFINLVESTLRTNYFQTDPSGQPKSYLSVKLDSKTVDELPLPRPFREAFVYSPRMEGIHMRFGKVARGGIRWSDRREDFRTEVLGLVKAQQVKNAIIVPVGAKGGFVLKRPPAGTDRDAFQKEGIECYKILIRGLLDITDNLKGNRIVPPVRVVRRDDDDPYLVVAADKGTATFSDIANSVSAAYGFWLGDAFASGGSQGYDHKGMGITARGAWESVKRHFRETGVDTQSRDFTAVGCGDMAGDVFGNGMLQSTHTKLLGAFNHMHVFVDPDPDPKKSFAERKRLFRLPRSTWADYDKKAMSKGGAVYERSAKSIALSPEIRARFGIAKDKVTPNELIRALLTVSVDLMWLGGIGTYIKAAGESHADVGDRTNDAIRVNGAELRCKALGEGANLGTTQLGRIEYAMHGGRLNTDWIDNSGGVNTSDHEVNIKILLGAATAKGRLTVRRRDRLLADMTDEVAQLVLQHNYLQSEAMSVIHSRGAQLLEKHARLMRILEKSGRLDRAIEFLPDDETLAERAVAKQGLTRPEIAVTVSYSKLWLYDELLKVDVPDDPYLVDDLLKYFPTPLRVKYKPEILRHRLRREIIATRVTNSLVNRAGDTFVSEFMEKTGKSAAEITRAYIIGRQAFQLRGLWEAIEKLDNKIPAAIQAAMLIDVNHLMEWVTLWFLRKGQPGLDIGSHIQEFAGGIAELGQHLVEVLPPHYVEDVRNRAKPYVGAGIPEKLAMRVAGLVNLYSGCDIVRLATRRKLPVVHVARTYFAIGTRFRLGRLRAAADKLASHNHWQQLAVAALIEEIYGHHLALASQVLDFANGSRDTKAAIDRWIEKNRSAVEPTEQLLNELWATELNDIAMIAVASRQLRAMSEARTAQ